MSLHKQGEKLRKVREGAGFTQQQVASALNIDRSTYASYEIGRSQPSPSTLVILSRIYHTPIEGLLDDDLATSYVYDMTARREKEIEYEQLGEPLPPDSRVFDLSKDEHTILCLYRAATREQREKTLEFLLKQLHGEKEKP